MWVRGAVDGYPCPPQLLDSDECLVNVGVLRHEERAQVQRELFRVEDVRGRLCEDCGASSSSVLNHYQQ